MKNTITVIMQSETVTALAKVPAGTVAAQSSRLGVYEGEPLLVIADALLSYAKAYRGRFECPISDDGVGAEAFADMVRGVKTFLDYDAAWRCVAVSRPTARTTVRCSTSSRPSAKRRELITKIFEP